LKNFDNSYLTAGIRFLAGIDEAGRGPLAGPVVAAAVIFSEDTYNPEINDSKKVSPKLREILFDWIMQSAVSVGIGIIDQNEIDKINILQAALKAMKIAAGKLKPQPDLLLIDGNKIFESKVKTIPVIKGDSKSFSIAAASIIAKVTRDRIMEKASLKEPQYLWHKNKGYGTREHIEAIKKFGYTSFHRKTFLTNILFNNK